VSRRSNSAWGGWPAVLVWLIALLLPLQGVQARGESGLEIIKAALDRHDHFPYTFEKQSMVLVDAAKNRTVRQMRRFLRVGEAGELNYLLVFDYPLEISGVTLRARRDAAGRMKSTLFLPAFGDQIKSGTVSDHHSPLFGSDFTVRDLTPELIADYSYEREADLYIDGVPHVVVAARPLNDRVERASGYSLRRIFLRRDNYYPSRIDYYDRHQRLFKRETHHDLKQVDGQMWRANMVLMEDFREQHRSLIKVERRIFSIDYVPMVMFSDEWVLANHARRPTVVEEVVEQLDERENELLSDKQVIIMSIPQLQDN